eukprot:scaffold51471_cov56-Phaeocystis_antarctica.AAC.1
MLKARGHNVSRPRLSPLNLQHACNSRFGKSPLRLNKGRPMRCLLLAALVTLTASFASTPSPSPCDREAMATDASGEYSCGARIEWLKSNDGLTDWWAHEQVAQENPNPNLPQP